jgi:hypothetical protein
MTLAPMTPSTSAAPPANDFLVSATVPLAVR